MIRRPLDIGRFEFVVLSSLRAAQLLRGCPPKVEIAHKVTTTAQLEISSGVVARLDDVLERTGE